MNGGFWVCWLGRLKDRGMVENAWMVIDDISVEGASWVDWMDEC